MAEWWNLDQALIWMVTRDAEQVERGQGDPEGVSERDLIFLGLEELGTAAEDEGGSSGGDEHAFYAERSSICLLRQLRDGRIRAQRADQDEERLLPPVKFQSYRFEPFGKQAVFILAKPRTKLEMAKGTPPETLIVLVSADDLRREFPAFAPADPQRNLVTERALDQSPPPRNRARNRATPVAENCRVALRQAYPKGIPKLLRQTDILFEANKHRPPGTRDLTKRTLGRVLQGWPRI